MSTIVGRELELQALNAAYAAMNAGRGSVLFLTGEAGLGKTTLVREWWKSARLLAPVETDSRKTNAESLFLESACSVPIGNVDVGRLEALQPWADVIAQLQAAGDAPAEDHKLNIKKLIRDSAPAWLWALPLVGEVAHAALVTARLAQAQRSGKSQGRDAGIPEPASASDSSLNSTAQNQQQVFQQYVNLLVAVSRERPLVIFLDDVHWADTSSCNLLFHLSRQVATRRILVVVTYRQDDAMLAQHGAGHPVITIKNEILRYSAGEEITLSYLSRTALRKYLATMFPAYRVDDRFERWLEKISDGNSLFVTQFISTLAEDKLLTADGAFVGDYSAISIPPSAQAVVEERTRRIDAPTRELLRYATVEGEEFTSYVLARLAEKQPMELLRVLREAETSGIIRAKGSTRFIAGQTTSVFGFSHALFHKALYDSLLDEEREYLHRRCYDILKMVWDETGAPTEHSTTLVTKLLLHAEKCGEWAMAAELALRAASDLWKTFNETEALEMISRTFTALNHQTNAQPSIAGEACFLRALIQSVQGMHEISLEDFRTAEGIFAEAGLPERRIDAVQEAAGALARLSKWEDTLGESIRALTMAKEIQYRKGEANALRNIGLVKFDTGRLEEAITFFEQSRALCEEIGDKKGVAYARLNIGRVSLASAANANARSNFDACSTMFVEIGDRQGEAAVQMCVGHLDLGEGRSEVAISMYRKSLETFLSIGNREASTIVAMSAGDALREAGLFPESLAMFEHCRDLFAETGNSQGEVDALTRMAEVYRRQSNEPEAEACDARSKRILSR